jgi:hypothetical protein
MALVVIAGVFLYKLLAEDWDKFLRSVVGVDASLFGMSVALGVLTNLVASFFFAFLLSGHAEVRYWRPIIRIFLVSQVVRYVPGKVWSYFYQLSSLPAEIPKTATILTNIEMFVINTLVVSMASLVAILRPGYLNIVAAVVASSLVVVLGYKFGLVDRVLNSLLGLLARFGVRGLTRRPYKASRMTLVIGVWMLLIFCSFLLALHAIWSLTANDGIVYVACLLLSWVLSTLVFIVPVGLGIRETGFVAISALMLSSLDAGQLAATAIIIRFWQLIVDILTGFCGFLLVGGRERKEE